MIKTLFLLLSVTLTIKAAPNTKSCHGSDYLKCAFVIAGCTAQCGSSGVKKSYSNKINSNCFQDWMNCMINCVINQHHQECIDCISRTAEVDEKQDIQHTQIGQAARNLQTNGFSNVTSQYSCECGSCGCERCGTFHCCACTSDGYTDYCRPSCECNCQAFSIKEEKWLYLLYRMLICNIF